MSISSSLYLHVPIWLQNMMVSLRGLEYRFGRSRDEKIGKQLEFLSQSQYWSEDQFVDYQTACLRALIMHSFSSVPYYLKLCKTMGCRPEDFASIDDFSLLPITEKSVLRGNEKEFLSCSYNPDKSLHFFTSGTTGTPINIYESAKSFSDRMAFVARLRNWAGLRNVFYPKRAQFTGRDIIPNRQRDKMVFWRHNYAGNALLLSTTHLSVETIPYYAEVLRAFKPDLMDGYPSAMLIIARVARRLGIELPRPKAIIVTAETITPEDKALLSDSFGCKIFNQYAASEPSCFWCDCEQGTMHINPEYGISEIIDPEGKPVSPGEEGDVVVTSFLNPVMPLLRYRLGDVAVRESGVCSCGRRMPRIKMVLGRKDDILFVPERGYVGRLDPVLKSLHGIIETQIVQETFDSLHIKIVPSDEYEESTGKKLLENIQAKLGANVRLSLSMVAAIPRGKNGKFRSVISLLKDQYPDRM